MSEMVLIMRLAIILFLLFAGLPAAQAQDATQNSIARGAYVARLGDCTACHTAPGLMPFAGGLPMNSPFGIIYTTNITPDKTNGIGNYSLDDFTRVLRRGIAKDGHHLYPAMPYASYSRVSDNDIKDMYDYFMQGVTPVNYAPPKTRLPFPLNQRWGLAIWNWLFAPDEIFKPNTKKDATWNRGAYLVEGLGHCGACHTPRTILFNEQGYTDKDRAFLTGYTLDNWHSSNLRGDRKYGLGNWNEDDLLTFFKTGHGGGATAYGSMQQVVEESTQYFTDEDIKSVARYLKSLEPDNPAVFFDTHSRPPAQSGSYPKESPGAGLYQALCSRCHGLQGEGKAPFYPTLQNNSVILTKDPTSLVHIVLQGGQTPRTKTEPTILTMPAFDNLTDQQIADVISYVRTSWGNETKRVSVHTVASARKAIAKDDQSKREATQKSLKKVQ